MTTQYGIGVLKNRFELFEIDDEDPLEVIKNQEQEKEARKKTKLSEKENKGKEPSVSKPKVSVNRKAIKETQNLKSQDTQKPREEKQKTPAAPRGERVERNERKFDKDREDMKNRRNERPPQSDVQREERGGDRNRDRSNFYGEPNNESRIRGGRGGRGSFGGRGGSGPRGGRGGGPRAGFDSRGKREFDRQSGSDKTGVKQVDKREGFGAHNWGNHRDDLEDIPNPANQGHDDTNNHWTPEKTETEHAETTATTTEGEEPSTNQDEEKKELTLDEWKALRGPRQKPAYNLRKAGEGEDLSQWKKMYALQKKKEDEEEEEYEYENCEYPQRVGRQRHILDIDIHFKDTRGNGRGGRGGGRGTGRGGGVRMGMRGTNFPNTSDKHLNTGRDGAQKSAPKVDDEHDFPSLG